MLSCWLAVTGGWSELLEASSVPGHIALSQNGSFLPQIQQRNHSLQDGLRPLVLKSFPTQAHLG